MAGATDIARKQYNSFLNNLGRSGVHSLFPNDFEYYAVSIELTNSKNELVDALVFPVMPNSISESKTPTNSIKRTNSGVISLFNPTFNPYDINLSGNFGRKFRILSNKGLGLFTALRTSTIKLNIASYVPKAFNTRIKTGYGVTKILDRIYNRSYELDESGQPHKLYFYNLALNTQNLVEFKNLVFTQDASTNMIWNYNMSLRAIAPAYAIRANVKSSVINILASSIINNSLNSLMGNIKSTTQERLLTRRFS